MDVRGYNRKAWDRQVENGNQWTVPVGPEVIAAASRGQWEVLLTDQKPVPQDWFPEMEGADVLCLASGGGQTQAGFLISGFYEDRHRDDPIAAFMPTFVATRAIKP
jgi:hypothetical protein